MRILCLIITVVGLVFVAKAQSLRECEYFRLREGVWAGKTTAVFLAGTNAPSVERGEDRNEGRFLSDGEGYEVVGVTSSGGETQEYRYAYRAGENPGEYAYTYTNSAGRSHEGVAMYSARDGTFTIPWPKRTDDTQTVGVERFPDTNRLKIVMKTAHDSGMILFRGTAEYKKDDVAPDSPAQ